MKFYHGGTYFLMREEGSSRYSAVSTALESHPRPRGLNMAVYAIEAQVNRVSA